jgi:hypothetical protein
MPFGERDQQSELIKPSTTARLPLTILRSPNHSLAPSPSDQAQIHGEQSPTRQCGPSLSSPHRMDFLALVASCTKSLEQMFKHALALPSYLNLRMGDFVQGLRVCASEISKPSSTGLIVTRHSVRVVIVVSISSSYMYWRNNMTRGIRTWWGRNHPSKCAVCGPLDLA